MKDAATPWGHHMKIQVNSDNNINGGEDQVRMAEEVLKSTLGHLSGRITRVELHLSDENGETGGGGDKRCMIEARLEGHQPIAVTDEAQTISSAIAGAADKLRSSLEHTLGRLSDHEDRKHANSDAIRDSTGPPEG